MKWEDDPQDEDVQARNNTGIENKEVLNESSFE